MEKINFWEMLGLDKFENVALVFHSPWHYDPKNNTEDEEFVRLMGKNERNIRSDRELFGLYANGESEFVVNMTQSRGSEKLRGRRLHDGDVAFNFIPYPYGKNLHILVSAFRVVDAQSKRVVEKVDLDEYEPYLGRLVILYENKRGLNPRRANPEIIKKISVAGVLGISAAKAFPGFLNVKLTYRQLAEVLKVPDWVEKLKARKGVYLITDRATGRQYVGSASGAEGIYGRWAEYVRAKGNFRELPQGENKVIYPNEAFRKLIAKSGSKEYIEENFQYSILETFEINSEAQVVLDRESWWKEVLLTKEHGYNRN